MPSSLMERMYSKSSGNSGIDDDSASTISRDSAATLVDPSGSSDQTENADKEGTRQVGGYIKLCNHETLPYERFKRILQLPNFVEQNGTIDALGSIEVAEHRRPQGEKDRQCIPLDRGMAVQWWYPVGFYSLTYVTKPSYREIAVQYPDHPGLEMTITWSVGGKRIDHNFQSKDRLVEYLTRIDIALCPHMNIQDPWILDQLFKVTHPDQVHIDPIDEWMGESDCKPYRRACRRCATVFILDGTEHYPYIYAIRFLGDGTSADDPIWLAQCAGK